MGQVQSDKEGYFRFPEPGQADDLRVLKSPGPSCPSASIPATTKGAKPWEPPPGGGTTDDIASNTQFGMKVRCPKTELERETAFSIPQR